MKPATGSKSCLLGISILVLVAGCGQFTANEVPDPCPGEKVFKDLNACFEDKKTFLSPEPHGSIGSHEGETRAIAGRRIRHAVALDYSGSMYGGYSSDEEGNAPCGWHLDSDRRRVKNGPYYWEQKAFSEFLAGGPLGALTGEEAVHPLVFNRTVTALGVNGSVSSFDAKTKRFLAPLPLPFRGATEVLKALTSGQGGHLPMNPAQAGFGDPSETHLRELLEATEVLFESFEERNGVLWIVTDNIIERGEADGSVSRDVGFNRQFYQYLENNPNWQVVQAWPVHEASWLCGSTLMVYGLYYSSRSRIDEKSYNDLVKGPFAQIGHERQVESFKRHSNVRSPAQGLPFKLKPADIDVVKVSFVGNVNCEPVNVGMSSSCRAKVKVENLLHHRKIKAARITLVNERCDPWAYQTNRFWPFEIAVPFCGGVIEQSVPLDAELLPDQPNTQELEFEAPPIAVQQTSLADRWISAGVNNFLMIGRMKIEIDQVETEMVIPGEALENIYGVDSLPVIFRHPRSDRLQPTTMCLPIHVRNPSYLAAVALFGTAFAGAAAALIFWILKPSFRTIVVDGTTLGLFRLVRQRRKDLIYNSQRIGYIKLGWKGSPVLRGITGHKILRRGSGWIHIDEAAGAEHRIEVVSRVTPPVQRGNDAF